MIFLLARGWFLLYIPITKWLFSLSISPQPTEHSSCLSQAPDIPKGAAPRTSIYWPLITTSPQLEYPLRIVSQRFSARDAPFCSQLAPLRKFALSAREHAWPVLIPQAGVRFSCRSGNFGAAVAFFVRLGAIAFSQVP